MVKFYTIFKGQHKEILVCFKDAIFLGKVDIPNNSQRSATPIMIFQQGTTGFPEK